MQRQEVHWRCIEQELHNIIWSTCTSKKIVSIETLKEILYLWPKDRQYQVFFSFQCSGSLLSHCGGGGGWAWERVVVVVVPCMENKVPGWNWFAVLGSGLSPMENKLNGLNTGWVSMPVLGCKYEKHQHHTGILILNSLYIYSVLTHNLYWYLSQFSISTRQCSTMPPPGPGYLTFLPNVSLPSHIFTSHLIKCVCW